MLLVLLIVKYVSLCLSSVKSVTTIVAHCLVNGLTSGGNDAETQSQQARNRRAVAQLFNHKRRDFA